MTTDEISRLKRTLSRRLAMARDIRRLSQEQLGKRIGRPHTMISHWESEEQLPNLTNLKRVCDALDISVDWIMGRSEQMEV